MLPDISGLSKFFLNVTQAVGLVSTIINEYGSIVQ